MNERYKASKVILESKNRRDNQTNTSLEALDLLYDGFSETFCYQPSLFNLFITSYTDRPRIEISYFRIEVTEKLVKFKQGDQSRSISSQWHLYSLKSFLNDGK